MTRLRTIIISVLIAVLCISCGKKEAPVAEPEEQFNFKVQFVLGDVKILNASVERMANSGDAVSVSDIIITGKKSVTDLLFGKSGVIRINENSRVTITAVADKTNNDTVMDMENGKVFLTLTKLKGTGFKVKTPTAVASVRGTSFTVLSDKKGAKLSVVKGTVAVNPVKEGKIIEDKSVDVEAGKKTDYIDKKVVEKIIMGKMEIPVMNMTPAEKIEIQAVVKDIKIEEIPDLTLEVKDEIKKETGLETTTEINQDDKAKQDAEDAKKKLADEKKKRENELKQQEELKRLAEEKKRQEEEELKRLAEEKKKKEEQQKKDRASNIPTM